MGMLLLLFVLLKISSQIMMSSYTKTQACNRKYVFIKIKINEGIKKREYWLKKYIFLLKFKLFEFL
jgi:hypothetical protein